MVVKCRASELLQLAIGDCFKPLFCFFRLDEIIKLARVSVERPEEGPQAEHFHWLPLFHRDRAPEGFSQLVRYAKDFSGVPSRSRRLHNVASFVKPFEDVFHLEVLDGPPMLLAPHFFHRSRKFVPQEEGNYEGLLGSRKRVKALPDLQVVGHGLEQVARELLFRADHFPSGKPVEVIALKLSLGGLAEKVLELHRTLDSYLDVGRKARSVLEKGDYWGKMTNA